MLGALAGVLGSLMALEAIREIVGEFVDGDEGLVGRLLMVDTRAMRFETLTYAWDEENPLNGAEAAQRSDNLLANLSFVTRFNHLANFVAARRVSRILTLAAGVLSPARSSSCVGFPLRFSPCASTRLSAAPGVRRRRGGNSGGGMGGGLLEFLATGVPGAAARPAGARRPAARRPRAGPAVAALAPAGLAPHRAGTEQFRRQEVAYDGPEPPGAIVIDTPHRFLYLVEPAAARCATASASAAPASNGRA